MSEMINKIKALSHSGNFTEKMISRFIIDLDFDVTAYTATSMGEHLGTSDSSIIRFTKSLGFKGYPSFKMALIAQSQMTKGNESLYGSISVDDSSEVVIEKSKVLFAGKIEDSLSLLNPEDIETCANLLLLASKIVVVGIGSSAIVAMDINHKLVRNGFNVHFNADYHTQMVQASLLTEKDVLIVISARGNSPEMVAAVENAKLAGAHIIAITRYGRDKIACLADYLLPYAYSEDHAQLGMVTSQVLQMVAFDVLFFRITALMQSKEIMAKAITSIRYKRT